MAKIRYGNRMAELPASDTPWDIVWHFEDGKCVGCFASNREHPLHFIDFEKRTIYEVHAARAQAEVG